MILTSKLNKSVCSDTEYLRYHCVNISWKSQYSSLKYCRKIGIHAQKYNDVGQEIIAIYNVKTILPSLLPSFLLSLLGLHWRCTTLAPFPVCSHHSVISLTCQEHHLIGCMSQVIAYQHWTIWVGKVTRN